MRSHSWTTNSQLLLPRLGTSASDATLLKPQQFASSKRKTLNYGVLHTKSGTMPKAPAAATSSSSAILATELRLKEVLMTTPAWPPSRTRAQASLDALSDFCQQPSTFAGTLPLVLAELTKSVNSRHDGGARAATDGVTVATEINVPPAPCYFEVAEGLQQEIQQLREEIARMQQKQRRAEEELQERDARVEEAQSKSRIAEVSIIESAARETQAANKLKAAHKEYKALKEEKRQVEEKLIEREQMLDDKDEFIKGVELQVFVEEQKGQESQALFKEQRAKAKAAAAAAAGELRNVQRMLLRAQHACLRAEGKGSETIDLAALTVQQQLKRAMDWAGGLGRVDVEIELSSENAMASSIVSSLRGR